MGIDKLYAKKSGTAKLSYCAMLIALSAIGAMIKIQGSIAFDSMPGFFAALFLGPGAGALVAGLGHLLTAMTSGFPMTVQMHLVVALEMAICGYVFGWVYRKSNGILASLVAIIINGPILTLLAAPLAVALGLVPDGWMFFKGMVIVLTIASAVNVILAYVLFKVLKRRIA